MVPYAQTKKDVLQAIEAREKGLSEKQATERLSRYGRNVLEEKAKKTLLQKIWEQARDPMVVILIAAAAVSGLLKEAADTVIILAVVALNTVIGLVQESKAEKAIEALKKISAVQAKVLRDGQVRSIAVEMIVPGDIVLLDAGDMVPADMRLLESSSLRIEEASLTGESVPSEKDAEAVCTADCPLGDRINMAFSGSTVVYGRGSGVVTATGMNTEIGRIAGLIISAEEEKTPLQRKLSEIGVILTRAVLGISLVIFLAALFKLRELSLSVVLQAFLLAVSLAVAAIPEGLPAVVTVVMALGVTRMAKRKAIIRKLPAVETLGGAEIICTDKTGTLTQNKMTVKQIWFGGRHYSAGDYLAKISDRKLADILMLANDAEIDGDKEIGDPTETALKRFVLQKYSLQDFQKSKRLAELPFDSERKMMTVINAGKDGAVVHTKGAPDELLKICTHIYDGSTVLPLTEEDAAGVQEANREMANKALRVIGAAYKPHRQDEEPEEKLIFAGLVGMIDPPRPEAYAAVKKCKDAGITPVMITGDHIATAVAVALDLGIITDASEAIEGRELDALSDEQFASVLDRYKVYARVTPEHKVRIVKAWKKAGKVVAMTGDGVNDAPSLKIADIGISMGITGTDVAKDVSDMLLADDNFATIVSAVEEGRKIYTNIRKAVQFLLSTNMSEVLSLLIATLVLPAGVSFLSPVHILWINLVTDSIPAIGLGVDKAGPSLMNEPPRDTRESFFAGGLAENIIYQGLFIALFTLASYYLGIRVSPAVATTMAFVTLSTSQFAHAINIKRGSETVFSLQTFNNGIILLGGFLLFSLNALILSVPALASLFKVTALSGSQWLYAILLSFAIVPFVEAVKLVQRMKA
ncbi:MAG: calcium-translocating P-type ATPase, PMCA-type [Bacillota bacterium]|nr:calcium-translocating P-type ATPase, PMCA-type [Bacillota bacterium]HHU29628.1 calcium-translocating P-type ATPase, PMCA-type [Bacillota bacterium]